MPPKTRKTMKRKPRRYRRKTKITSMVRSGTSPIPDVYKTTLNYSDLITLSYSGTTTNYQFNLNNLNDPNRTGTGHQPNGYDQLATLYTRTRVTGASYVITFSNGSATYQAECLVQLNANTSLNTTFADAIETRYVKRVTLDPYGSESKTVRGRVDLPKLFGVTRAHLLTDDDYVAGIGGNPANQCCLNIWVQNISTGTAITVYARVNIKYNVDFYEARVFDQS